MVRYTLMSAESVGAVAGVSAASCAAKRRELNDRLASANERAAVIETKLDLMLNITRLVLGAVVSGVVTIVVLLLTRGL